MRIIGSAIVVTFDVQKGVRLAACWDGGPVVNVHAIHDGRYGPCVDQWSATDSGGCVQLEPTCEGLAVLVGMRLEDEGTARQLADFACEYSQAIDHTALHRQYATALSLN